MKPGKECETVRTFATIQTEPIQAVVPYDDSYNVTHFELSLETGCGDMPQSRDSPD